MKVEVKQFHIGMLDEMKAKPEFHGNVKSLVSRIYMVPKHDEVAVLVDDVIVAVIGLIEHWPGVAEAWSVTTELVYRTPISFHRTVKRLLDGYVRMWNLRRVHMTVTEGSKRNERWAMMLGFELEGRLRKLSPDGRDQFMYARVR